ncbi:MAG: hypothetical protein LKE33_10850 [Acidaminococcus sp.]|jgi:hypothetical protein|nr:hypothetical protein [Acidaminococcus sp.]MCI2099977.1 hypothetical protein [Acidaminococcus sp.]MCI2114253.1 hypothetical protein [Acidaminococcus sp.]MCI2116233.1 hypothetical protein [Acidaminococcus sp.]
MLLYSTVLCIKESLTLDAFIELVIRWNQESPHQDNIISGITWNGELNIRYGNDRLWLAFQNLEEQAIEAVRYEKRDPDGTIWDTDYIMNFRSHKMAIRLDRTYSEGALMENIRFSTPYFISLLIREGYVQDDGKIPILSQPQMVDSEQVSFLQDAFRHSDAYRLPLVYISRDKKNQLPCDAEAFAWRLKGQAHVFTAASNGTLPEIADNGAIGICFPNGRKEVVKAGGSESGEAFLNRICRLIAFFLNVQVIDSLETWEGVQNALLARRIEGLREKIKNQDEDNDLLEAAMDENAQLEKQNQVLQQRRMSLEAELAGLRRKMSTMGGSKEPILYRGQEHDLYEGEIREILLSILEEKKNNLPDKKTRRRDVLEDILNENQFGHLVEQHKKTIRRLLNGYGKMGDGLRRDLEKFGFVIKEDGKHYKLIYHGDERYSVTIAKTGSDHREGKNNVSYIVNEMF